MSHRIPIPEDLRPFPVPDDYAEGATLDAHVALLHELRELRLDLTEERTRSATAEDAAWAQVAEALHELTRNLGELDESLSRAQLLEKVEEAVAGLLRAEEVELRRATGSVLSDLDPEDFEILARAPAAEGAAPDLVLETHRPAVFRRGRRLRSGKIVVSTEEGEGA